MEKTEAELKDEFLEEYRKLVMKYGFDFIQQPPMIVRINILKEPPKEEKKNE